MLNAEPEEPLNDPIPIFGQAREPVSVLRCFIVALLAVFLVILGGFIHFAASLPSPAQGAAAPAPKADAIVVLTGARDRIGEAVKLLEEGRGQRLLISGVNQQVSGPDLAETVGVDPATFDCCIDLGFEARSTDGNAAETAAWVRENSYTSLIVVTSDYHMPRSLHVLGEAMPEVELVPYSVALSGPSAGRVWRNVTVARVLVSEYAKYVVTLVRARLA